jgi:hypothetical protein
MLAEVEQRLGMIRCDQAHLAPQARRFVQPASLEGRIGSQEEVSDALVLAGADRHS